MALTRDSKSSTTKRPFSFGRLVANIGWVTAIVCILAPAVLELSASGRETLQVVGGLAFFAFMVCGIVGIVQVKNHQKKLEQESAAARSDDKNNEP